MTTLATSYTELMAGIQAQVEAMNLRLSDFDDLAGFPSGLSGKVFGMLQVKRLGPEKLFDAIRAAGCRLRLEVDPEQRAKMQARIAENYNPRQANQARTSHAASTPSSAVLARVFKAMGRKGGKKRWHKATKEERSEHMRMMAMAGVRKRRKEQKRRARQRKRAHEARKLAAIAAPSGPNKGTRSAVPGDLGAPKLGQDGVSIAVYRDILRPMPDELS